MKNILSITTLGLSIITLLVCVFIINKKDKIVYVDSIKLVSGYNGSKLLKAEFDKKAANWKAKTDTLSVELSQTIERYEKEESKLSAASKIARERDITLKQEEFENYRKVVSEMAQKEDQRITTQILKEVSDFLKKYGEANRYRFILAATTGGNIVYASEGTDITDEVLNQLNKGFKP